MARQNPNRQITFAAQALRNEKNTAVTSLLLLSDRLLCIICSDITYGWFTFTFNNHLNPCKYVQV